MRIPQMRCVPIYRKDVAFPIKEFHYEDNDGKIASSFE